MKMTESKTRVLLFVGAALGLLALCFLAVRHSDPAVKGTKTYERRVAEGLRVWNPKAGVDSIRFESCRIEKMKSGPITFGGLDIFCVKGLVLNLPFPEDDEGCDGETGTGNVASTQTDRIAGIPTSILRKSGLPFGKVSGLRVSGLAVNRIEDKTEVPVFSADELRNRGRSLVLTNCRVYDEGRTDRVHKATLKMEPYPVLAWNGGERRLDDLFPNNKEKMK